MANETPTRPPPFMANAILNFHFDYWHPSLNDIACSLWLGGGQEKVGASGFQNKQTLPDRTFPNQLFPRAYYQNGILNELFSP